MGEALSSIGCQILVLAEIWGGMMKIGLVFLCALCLLGCGGGGGGSSPTISLALSPATLEGQTFEEYPLSFSVVATATMSGDISGNVFVTIFDGAGILARTPTISQFGEMSYHTDLETSRALRAGTYKGSLQIKTCADSACRKVYGNTALPYHFTVSGPSTSPPLSPLAGAYDWSTLQGNAGRNAYVPVTLDPAKFLARWRFAIPSSNTSNFVYPLVSTGNRVYLLAKRIFGPASADLYSLQENDGALDWTLHFKDEGVVTAPTTSPGNLYFQSFDRLQGTLWSVDPSSGVKRFAVRSMCAEDCAVYDARQPVFYDGKIYGKSGEGHSSHGLAAFDVTTGLPDWTTNLDFNPTLADGSLFSYMSYPIDAPYANGLIVRSSSTGAITKIIKDPEFSQDSIIPLVKIPGTSHVFV
ncbi:MAG: hypothetical protein U1D69_12035, partial [Polynucleobacter sp.]|nr:hypothetical protein [Polynucleobacter sp.]